MHFPSVLYIQYAERCLQNIKQFIYKATQSVLSSIEDNSWKKVFSCVMHFLYGLNFSSICSVYNNLQIIYKAAQRTTSKFPSIDGNCCRWIFKRAMCFHVELNFNIMCGIQIYIGYNYIQWSSNTLQYTYREIAYLNVLCDFITVYLGNIFHSIKW